MGVAEAGRGTTDSGVGVARRGDGGGVGCAGAVLNHTAQPVVCQGTSIEIEAVQAGEHAGRVSGGIGHVECAVCA